VGEGEGWGGCWESLICICIVFDNNDYICTLMYFNVLPSLENLDGFAVGILSLKLQRAVINLTGMDAVRSLVLIRGFDLT
jgi:hypothetical protein